MSSAAHPSEKPMALRNFSSKRGISVLERVIPRKGANNKILACESTLLRSFAQYDNKTLGYKSVVITPTILSRIPLFS
jgi:hypothetical protein